MFLVLCYWQEKKKKKKKNRAGLAVAANILVCELNVNNQHQIKKMTEGGGVDWQLHFKTITSDLIDFFPQNLTVKVRG